jgi:hypothetical protein
MFNDICKMLRVTILCEVKQMNINSAFTVYKVYIEHEIFDNEL